MKLVITEKPSVARDIARVLNVSNQKQGYFEGNNMVISWAFGHLIELCQPDEYNESFKQWHFDTLPILPESFKKKVTESGKDQFLTIESLFKRTDIQSVICATDAGREGELIFRMLYDQCGSKLPIERLWISSQTDTAIKEGFQQLKSGTDYEPLHDSARCRSEADWLVGINATRAYSIKFSRGHGVMSVGRVQTPVLKMIVARYRAHTQFESKPFFEVLVDVDHPNGAFQSKWFTKDTDRCDNKEDAETIKKDIDLHKTGIIESLNKRSINEKPPLLYDLTELQKDANRQFNYSADQTLKLAQSLYETHKILSYPRTSSRYLSTDIEPKCTKFLDLLDVVPTFQPFIKQIKTNAWTISKRMIDNKKVTDHHAIIPTDKRPDMGKLTEQEENIYMLVIKRFLAAFYPDCEKNHTEIITAFGHHRTKAVGTIIAKMGWRDVYKGQSNHQSDKKKDKETLLPAVTENDAVHAEKVTVKKGQTKAPPLHTEASILAAMETAGKHIDDEELRQAMKHCGLGTPATRAQILEKLIHVKYVTREKTKLIPTDKAEYIIDSIKQPELLSAELTGEWEKLLNQMADGQYLRSDYMENIKTFTQDIIKNVGQNQTMAIRADKKIYGNCPACGNGKIIETKQAYSCTNWKETGCKFVVWKEMAKKSISEKQVETLLKKGKTSVIKGFKNKEGNPFNAALEIINGEVKFNFIKDAIAACPICDGKVIETAKAYSCDQWRETGCKFVIWKEIAKRKITKLEAITLLKDNELKQLDGFKSKAGKPFAATLVLRDHKVEFLF